MKRIRFAQHKMLTQDSEVFEGQQTENVKHIAFIHSQGNSLIQKKQQLWLTFPALEKNIF